VYVVGKLQEVVGDVLETVKAALTTLALSEVLVISAGPAAKASVAVQAKRVAVILLETANGVGPAKSEGRVTVAVTVSVAVRVTPVLSVLD